MKHISNILRLAAAKLANRDLLIDDEWDPSKLGISDHAKTSDEALELLKQGGWGTVYLDNDLGPGQMEGCQILDWMMRTTNQDPKFEEKWPQRFVIFSANNQARPRMESKIRAMGYEPAGTDHKGHPVWERPQV